MELFEIGIDNFELSDEARDIFAVEGIQDARSILETLEMYKFFTRDRIVARVNELCPKVHCTTVDRGSVRRNRNFASLERDYGVIINEIDSKNIVIYYPLFNIIARESISLDLAYYNIMYQTITDLNFDELCDECESKLNYKPSIIFKRILLEVMKYGATDLHITVEHVNTEPVYLVKYRKDGRLFKLDLFEFDANLNKSVIMWLIDQKTSSVSLDVSLASGVTANSSDIFNDGKVELRISAHKVFDGLRCTIRIQERKTMSFRIGDLGFPDDVQDALFKLANKHSGVTLITGAIRTGKNTTAYAMANEMIKRPINIISYDSPVEELMQFSQVDYRDDPESLLNYVRLAKKQDIDVAFLNEIPTKEVAFAIKDLVNSSIYVITTMHMDRIWHLPYRLKEYYGESYKDLITQINGVVNQKMFPVLCPYCKRETLTSLLNNPMREGFLNRRGISSVFIEGSCEFCEDPVAHSSGYVLGRNQPIVEFILFTNELKEQLVQCENTYEMEQVLKKHVTDNANSLEDYMSQAVKDGTLGVSFLDYIL